MVRKWASFALEAALIVALALAIAHAQPKKAVDDCAGFSIPSEPASPALKAASAWKVAGMAGWTFAPEHDGSCATTARASHVEAVPQSTSRAAPATYPPLLHRPPPSRS